MAAPKENKAFPKGDAGLKPKKTNINIVVIGHVDAGKSTLGTAVFNLQLEKGLADKRWFRIDRGKEESTRKVTIVASQSEFETDKYHITWVDCPGHADYIKNMISGAVQADVGILVLSSTEGIEKQSLEHILLAKQIGIKQIFILINDKSRVGEKIDEITEMAITADALTMLKEKGYEPHETSIAIVSALKALNGDVEEKAKLTNFLQNLDKFIKPPERVEDKPAQGKIEGVFGITGKGTVVTFLVREGIFKEGDTVKIVGMGMDNQTTVIRSLEMFGKPIPVARAGESVGANLRGTTKEQVRRGQTIAAMDAEVNAYTEIEVSALLCSQNDGGRRSPIKSGYKPQAFIMGSETTTELHLHPSVKEITPDKKEEVTSIIFLKLMTPVTCRVGDPVLLRESKSTVIRGVVIRVNSSKVPFEKFIQDSEFAAGKPPAAAAA